MSGRAIIIEDERAGVTLRYESDPDGFRWKLITTFEGRTVRVSGVDFDAADVIYQATLTVLGVDGPKLPEGPTP